MATEPEAVSAVIQLDPAAELRDFVSEHHARLIRLALLITRSVDEAEDAVQAAFERAWRHRASLADPTRLRPWLDRIVVREAIRGSRRPIRAQRAEFPASFDQGSANQRDASHEMIAVHQALDQLAPDHRAVVVLHLYAGYTVAETAAALNLRLETARSRLRVARDRLRHLLAEEG